MAVRNLLNVVLMVILFSFSPSSAASFAGMVNDNNQNAIAGALVYVGTDTVTTDNFGKFNIGNMSVRFNRFHNRIGTHVLKVVRNTITVQFNKTTAASIGVFNVNGIRIAEASITKDNKITMHIPDGIANGLYVIRVHHEETISTHAILLPWNATQNTIKSVGSVAKEVMFAKRAAEKCTIWVSKKGYVSKRFPQPGCTGSGLVLTLDQTTNGGLCAPCRKQHECGDVNDICLVNNNTGQRFCGKNCSGTGCPDGYTCQKIDGIDGTTYHQCTPVSGKCITKDTTSTDTTNGSGDGMGEPGYMGPFCEGSPHRHILGVAVTPASANPTDEEVIQYSLDAVNALRAMTGLKPLVLDNCLSDIAQRALDDLHNGGTMHGYFNKHCLFSKLGKNCECDWAQENYGMASGSTMNWKQSINIPLCGMMDEPKGVGHRGNIESKEWTRIGIAIRKVGGGYSWYHEFGR